MPQLTLVGGDPYDCLRQRTGRRNEPALLVEASPVRQIRETRVPLLVILAGEDYQAMQRQSREFVDAVRRRRLTVTFETIAGRSHYALVQSIGEAQDPTTDLMTRFVGVSR